MKSRELAVPGAWEFTPTEHSDDRGVFFEFYRFEQLRETVGHPINLRQGNISVSAKGVVRGIHYALVPPGQAKYVTAVRGAFIDFVIDLRVGSPTFAEWDSVVIDDIDHRSVYVSEGLGHAIVSLTETATVSYLVSEVFNPGRELAINAFDPDIGLSFPRGMTELIRSPKDAAAPALGDAVASKSLPSWGDSTILNNTLTNGA